MSLRLQTTDLQNSLAEERISREELLKLAATEITPIDARNAAIAAETIPPTTYAEALGRRLSKFVTQKYLRHENTPEARVLLKGELQEQLVHETQEGNIINFIIECNKSNNMPTLTARGVVSPQITADVTIYEPKSSYANATPYQRSVKSTLHFDPELKIVTSELSTTS